MPTLIWVGEKILTRYSSKSCVYRPLKMYKVEIMCFSGKSLSVDSRNGEVSEYDPLANPKSRGMSDLDAMSAMMSAFQRNIKLAYSPN